MVVQCTSSGLWCHNQNPCCSVNVMNMKWIASDAINSSWNSETKWHHIWCCITPDIHEWLERPETVRSWFRDLGSRKWNVTRTSEFGQFRVISGIGQKFKVWSRPGRFRARTRRSMEKVQAGFGLIFRPDCDLWLRL